MNGGEPNQAALSYGESWETRDEQSYYQSVFFHPGPGGSSALHVSDVSLNRHMWIKWPAPHDAPITSHLFESGCLKHAGQRRTLPKVKSDLLCFVDRYVKLHYEQFFMISFFFFFAKISTEISIWMHFTGTESRKDDRLKPFVVSALGLAGSFVVLLSRVSPKHLLFFYKCMTILPS